MNHDPGSCDPLAQVLRPLAAVRWRDEGHAQALLLRLEATPRQSRLGWLLAALALASLLLSATVVARLYFTAEIVDVQYGDDGGIERITLQTGDLKIVAQAIPDNGEVPGSFEVELDRIDGAGTLVLRVLRDRDRLLNAVLRATATTSSEQATPKPGDRYRVHEVPVPWLARLEADALVLVSRQTADLTRRIPRLPSATPGSRFGDDRIEVELLNH